jgi:steroid 5-alpha reductase family enzyme
MALYLSLSLLAVLLAIPRAGESDPIGLVVFTAIGLLVAHLLAFAISSRLVSRGLLEADARRVAMAQVLGGGLVVLLASVPMILFDAPTSLQVAEGLLLLFVAAVGYLAARQAQVSVLRSWAYVAVVIVCVGIVLGLKSLVGH